MPKTANYFEHIDYLMVEANSGCNLACRTCNRSELEANGLRTPKNLNLEEFKSVLDKFKKCPLKQIKFEGLSEPMLHPEFDKLASLLRATFPKAFVIIATNLQYNLPSTPFLKTLDFVDMIYLSIDGTESLYEKIRTGARYERLLKSLSQIKELVPSDVRAQKLHINFTLSPENYRELPKIYEMKMHYGLASVRINLAQNWSQEVLNPLSYSEEIIDFLRTYKKDIKGVGGWDYKDCFWPFNGLIVDVFGDVRQCIINTNMKPIGNIFRDDIEKLYNTSPILTEARKLLSDNRPPLQCQTCDYKHMANTLEKIFDGRGNLPKSKELPL